MDEAGIIARLVSRFGERADVILGPGDDAAIVAPPARGHLVIAVDSMFEGTHFPPATAAHALGHRCLAVNLSDLAAMGARPLWFVLGLSLPAADADWVDAFADGLYSLAERTGIALVGGDTVRGPLAVTVTVHGHVAAGGAVFRGGARPGDGIYVTGFPGEAAAGLQCLLGRGDTIDATLRARLERRFLYPEPRLGQGLALVPLASAMMDISDGLHPDLLRLMAASNAGADLEIESLPLSADLRDFAGDRACDLALAGGDDYELLFTLPPDRAGQLEELAADWPCPVTHIGEVRAGQGVQWSWQGDVYRVPPGFGHFPANAGEPA